MIESKIGVSFITEGATLLICTVLIVWYKKSSNTRNQIWIMSVIIGTFTALLLMYAFLLIWFLRVSNKFTTMGYEAEKEFSKQQDQYIPLVTTIFDKAEKTNVRQEIDKNYNKLLGYPKPGIEVRGDQSFQVFYPKGRKPVYFIRLKNGKLQKLFQSGDIKYEVIDTDGEKMVRDMLLGKAHPIQYPQHTCCGMDDVSWSDEVPFFRLFVPERRYLKDFYSELETILLIKDKNGRILGAMVDLHGD